MTERSWQHVWMDQCDAAEGIRLRIGFAEAFDYVVGEKLLNFAEAAARDRDGAFITRRDRAYALVAEWQRRGLAVGTERRKPHVRNHRQARG